MDQSDYKVTVGQNNSSASLVLTNTQLIITLDDSSSSPHVFSYSSVASVDKQIGTVNIIFHHFCYIKLNLKNYEVLYNTLLVKIRIVELGYLLAFDQNSRPITTPEFEGKEYERECVGSRIDLRKDYERMGVGSSQSQWRFTTINDSFAFSPTYPRLLAVPSKISDNVLRHIGTFRSKVRIPALSYVHPNNVYCN